MMPKPGLLDLRRVAKRMKVDHMFAGKRRLLSLSVFEGNKRHNGGGPCQWVFHMVHLRQSDGHARYLRIGSKRFKHVCNPSKNHQVFAKAMWLCLDMMHLIMLLARRTDAKKDVMRFWFHEAKDFLVGMEKTRLVD